MKADAFRDQVVSVTGASSGIGKALALHLAGQGAKVVLAAWRAELLEQIAADCHKVGGEALAVPTDVADQAQCKVLVEKTVVTFGRLDMLINNAGLAVIARLEDYTDLSLFQHVMDVNFYGAVYCTYYTLPHLIHSRGRIAAVSSLGNKAPLPYNSPYVASKFAMHGFFDSLRMELMKHGVSVTIICPYWVLTGFHEAQLDKDGVPRGSSGRAIYSKNMMTAERCAQVILRVVYCRQREVTMGLGRMIAWLKLLAPGLLDRIAIDFLKATVLREQKNALYHKYGTECNFEEAGMSKTTVKNLSGVSETYLAPLYWRAMESQRPDAIIKDEKAVELVAQMGLDFSRISQIKMNELLNAMRIMFTREFDRYARDFLSRHPEAVVVHIGCGLDSRFERVDNGRVEWYDLDLPDVIEVRQKLFGEEGERHHLLGCSVLEEAWLEVVKVHSTHPFLFLAETVFVYFEEAQVKSLMLTLCNHFPGAELVFDGWRPFEVWLGNRYLSNSPFAGLMQWGFWHGQEIEGWGRQISGGGIHLLDD